VPFLLLLVSFGLDHLLRQRAWLPRIAVAGSTVVLAWLSFTSISYARAATASPRDYASLASELRHRVKPDDVILVRNDYIHPPLFYYLDRTYDRQLVFRDYSRAVRSAPATAGAWLVRMCDRRPLRETVTALEGLHLAMTIPVRRAELQLWTRRPTGNRSGSETVRPPTGNGLGCRLGDEALLPPRAPVPQYTDAR
jgi:hypothetical protein